MVSNYSKLVNFYHFFPQAVFSLSQCFASQIMGLLYGVWPVGRLESVQAGHSARHIDRNQD